MDSHRLKTTKIHVSPKLVNLNTNFLQYTEHVYQIVDTLYCGELAISPLDWAAPRGMNVHCAWKFCKLFRNHRWLSTEDLYQLDTNFETLVLIYFTIYYAFYN